MHNVGELVLGRKVQVEFYLQEKPICCFPRNKAKPSKMKDSPVYTKVRIWRFNDNVYGINHSDLGHSLQHILSGSSSIQWLTEQGEVDNTKACSMTHKRGSGFIKTRSTIRGETQKNSKFIVFNLGKKNQTSFYHRVIGINYC